MSANARTLPQNLIVRFLGQWPLLPAALAGAFCSAPLVRAEGWLVQAIAVLMVGAPLLLGALFPRRGTGLAVAFNVALVAALPAAVLWLDPGRQWVADEPPDFIIWWLLRGIGAGVILAQSARLPIALRRYTP